MANQQDPPLLINETEKDYIIPEDNDPLELEYKEIIEQERIEQLNNLPFAPVPEILPLTPLISQNVCAICRSSRSTHALIPCGHRALCEECKGLLEQQRCPICAQPFFSILRIWDA
ncbi:putative inhibitor of apoptosis [Aphis craccivora]|uniref:Putative inhibitor of apoptosis n=1 Tax=Aphis craccivora TaxID=307492 RepID=A0A6G0VJH6_APHCR|nr:putative inhibitor of apoptosis [Aphis craccivora]